MAENSKLFYNKWESVLKARHLPRSAPQSAVIIQQYRGHLLWIDDIVPEPDHDSVSCCCHLPCLPAKSTGVGWAEHCCSDGLLLFEYADCCHGCSSCRAGQQVQAPCAFQLQ